jgi:hypothetical protein
LRSKLGLRLARLQEFLSDSPWDEEGCIEELQGFVGEQMGSADGVLILDDTGVAKKGIWSAGVARQYSGTLGRVDNCQVGVFLAYTSQHGHTLVDRRLYVPEGWFQPEAAATSSGGWSANRTGGIASRSAATPRSGAATLAGRSRGEAGWVDPGAVSNQQRARRRRRRSPNWPPRCPTRSGVRHRVTEGAKGPREYEFARIRVIEKRSHTPGPWSWMMVRWPLACLDPQDFKYYLSNAPETVALAEMAWVGCLRWTIEEDLGWLRARLGSIITRSPSTAAGTTTSPWSCWRWRS